MNVGLVIALIVAGCGWSLGIIIQIKETGREIVDAIARMPEPRKEKP